MVRVWRDCPGEVRRPRWLLLNRTYGVRGSHRRGAGSVRRSIDPLSARRDNEIAAQLSRFDQRLVVEHRDRDAPLLKGTPHSSWTSKERPSSSPGPPRVWAWPWRTALPAA